MKENESAINPLRGTGPVEGLGPEEVYYQEKSDESVQEKNRVGLLPYLSNQKRMLATQLNDTARALHDTGTQLPENGSAGLVRMSAEKIGAIGSYLENHDPEELAAALRDYAHAKPWRVIGGAFVIGLAAARIFKATGRA